MKKKFLVSVLIVLISQVSFAQKKVITKKPIKKTPTTKLPTAQSQNEYVKISTIYGDMVFMLYDETPKHRDNFKKLIREKFYDGLLFHRVIRDFMIQGGDPSSRNADSLALIGNGSLGYTIKPEFNKDIIHLRGALAAARLGDEMNPNKESNASQFYIVQGKKYNTQELEQVMNAKNFDVKRQIFNKLMMNDTSFAPNLARIKKNQGDEAAQKFIESSIGKETDKIFAEKEFIYTQKQAELYNEKGGAPHLDMEYTVFGQLLYGFDVLEKLSIVYTNQQTSRPVIDLKMQISIIKR